MTFSVQEQRERRNALAKSARNLLDKTVHPQWSDELQKQYDETLTQIEAIDAELARHQRLLDLEAEEHFKNLGLREGQPSGGSPLKPLLAKWLRGGDGALNAEDWQTIRNTMSTTTPAEGGYTVPTETIGRLFDAMKQYGGVRASGATILQTDAGNPMNFPTSDGTSEVGELIAENTTATAADPTFGTKALNVYKFSSKVVAVPFELLQDASLDIEGFVVNRLGMRIGRTLNSYFTTGTGTAQPNGVVTAAGSGKVGTTGQTTTVIYDDLVDLEHAVDPAYRAKGTCRWMMNDASLKVIRKLKDSQNRPLFLPSYDAGIARGAPAELAGYPIVINQDMAVMAANAKSILFGDFTNYWVRDVMAATLFRFTDSAYAKLGQVGFLMWARSGGNYMDVGNSLKYYQNSAT